MVVVEDLHFNAIRKSRLACLSEAFNGLRGDPDKDSRIARSFLVAPFNDHFKVFVLLGGAQHADGFSGAVKTTILPGPGVFGAVDLGEIFFAKGPPSGLLVIDEGAHFFT